MNKNLFSGLEDLGFDNIDEIDIYKKEEEKQALEEKEAEEKSSEEKQKLMLYDKEVTCPSCGVTFKARAVKTSSYRVGKKESDFYVNYFNINPYFYDVWLCNTCGYAALKSDFESVRSAQLELIQTKITPKWHGKKYPELYDLNIAIERYKLALLNYVVSEAKSSKKAMTCLKIAWMYRIDGNTENEIIFLKQALDGFNDAYFNENFPIYGMDKFTVMYLIGELNRRIGNFDDAMRWFSNVITSPGVNSKLKDIARDQKDLIKEQQASAKSEAAAEASSRDTEDFSVNKKKGFFSKLFK